MKATPEELIAHTRTQLAPFKVPHEIEFGARLGACRRRSSEDGCAVSSPKRQEEREKVATAPR